MRRMARVFLASLVMFLMGGAQQEWIDRTLVTEEVTVVWWGSMDGSPFRPPVQLELRQQGAKVTGAMKVPPAGSYSLGSGIPIEGSVNSDVFTFRDQRGIFSGELIVGADALLRQILLHCGEMRASLRRGSRGSQSDSATH